MEGFGIQDQAEEELSADYGENVVAGEAGAVGVAQADFEYRICPAGPSNGQGFDLARLVVVG